VDFLVLIFCDFALMGTNYLWHGGHKITFYQVLWQQEPFDVVKMALLLNQMKKIWGKTIYFNNFL
jgi:hypothetical protein